MDARKPSLVIKVGIATAGRADVLTATLEQFAKQSRLPDELIVCPAAPADCDEAGLTTLPYAARVVSGAPGLVLQRNAILDQSGGCDVLAFFDDDFYASTDYLARLEELFRLEPRVMGVTGKVLRDGAITESVDHDEALAILEARPPAPPGAHKSVDIYNLYGCNMAIRMDPVRSHGLRFDENLPMYGWLEDLDFTRRVARHGRLVKSELLTGVHLATKRGRSSGLRIGYSQIANPVYLMRKGTMAPWRAMRQIGRNVAKNAWRCVNPEPWVDRRGRLRGNTLAAIDLLRGRLDPRNIVSFR